MFGNENIEKAMEQASRRQCSVCPGKQLHEINLFGEVHCIDCDGRLVCLVSKLEVKKIEKEMENTAKANC